MISRITMNYRRRICFRWIVAYAIENLLLILWIVAQIIMFWFTFKEYLHNARFSHARLEMGEYTLPLARASTRLISFNSSLVLIPCCRFLINSLCQITNFIPLHSFRRIHVCIAGAITLFSLVHVASHFVNFVNIFNRTMTHGSVHALLWSHGTGITGIALVTLLFVIISTSDGRIRNYSYELFQYCHLLWIVVFAVASFHGAFCFIRMSNPVQCVFPTFFIWWLPSAGLYFINGVLRWRKIAKNKTTIYKVILHPSNVIEVQFFIEQFSFTPGQYLYFKVPSISKFQRHPFSITSCPLPSTKTNVCSIHVRMTGNWTQELGARCGASLQSKATDSTLTRRKDLIEVVDSFPQVTIDGPYGVFCRNIYQFETAILIGAGIGQTPFASLLRYLHHEYQATSNLSIQHVYFYAIARETNSFEWFYQLLRDIEQDDCNSFFTLSLTITEQFDHVQAANIHINDLEGIFDAVTKLKTPTRFGKFPFKAIFQELSTQHSEGKVGIFYCGPSRLGTKIQWESYKYSNFSFHSEEF